jgi:hypothetical protein
MNTLYFRRGGGIATVLTATFAALASQALAADFNNPADKPMLCELYAEKATNQAQQNIRDDCGGIGPRYTTDRLGHYNWCMAQKDVKVVNTEDELRSHQILRCNRCTGYVDARLEFEKKWNGMGCGEIPELVQMDRYRGGTQDSSRSLLMFSCTYPPMSTYEIADAEKADDAALARCAAVKQEQQVAKVKRAACGVYATDAAQKATQFKANSCVEDARYPGRMSTDVQQHYNWCFNVASGNGIQFERDGRNADLNRCIAAKQIASKIANSLPSTVKFPKTVQKFDHDQLYTPVKKLGVKHTEIEHDKLFTPVTKLGVKNTPPEQPKKIITKSVQVPRFKFPHIVLNFPRRTKTPPVVVTQTQTQTQTSSKPAPANSDEPRSRSGQTTGDLGFPP